MALVIRLYSDFVGPFCFVAERSSLVRLQAEFDVTWLPNLTDPRDQTFRDAMAEADGLIGGSLKMERDLLDAAQGRVDDAIAPLNDRLRASRQDAEAHHLLSRAYFALNSFDAAIREGEAAVALAPNNADYHLWLGRAYGRKAEHASWFTAASLAGKMRDQFERAVQLNGNDISARTDLSEFYI